MCEKFRAARTLSAVESLKDPETEPYRSKYSARALLQEVKQLLSAAEEGGEAVLAVRRAVLEYELGVNHTDTEELSAGEEHLQRCTQLLEPHRLSPDCVSLYIQAQVGRGGRRGCPWGGRLRRSGALCLRAVPGGLCSGLRRDPGQSRVLTGAARLTIINTASLAFSSCWKESFTGGGCWSGALLF